MKFQKGHDIGLATRFKKGEMPICGVRLEKGLVPWNKDLRGVFHHTQETKERISRAMIGRSPWNVGKHTGAPINDNRSYNNKRRYCCGCEKFYKEEEYMTFKNPLYCDKCNTKLRCKGRNYNRQIRNARYAYYYD